MENLQEYKEQARRAFSMTSFDPEKRGDNLIRELEIGLNEDLNEIEKATTEEKDRYIKGFKDRFSSLVSAKSRCMSTMITGGSNFPVRRAQKANDQEHKRSNDLYDYRVKVTKAILKRIQDRKPESEKQDEAWVSIEKHILSNAATIIGLDTGTVRGYSRPLFVSSMTGLIKRMAKNGQAEHVKKSLDLIRELNSQNKKPIISAKAKVWELEEVAQEVQADKEADQDREDKEYFYDGFKVALSYSDDRLRIVHDEKPDRETIDKIKSHGFKWSRYNVAWQRKLTNNALYVTFKILLKDVEQLANEGV
jgi:hypothetical protein